MCEKRMTAPSRTIIISFADCLRKIRIELVLLQRFTYGGIGGNKFGVF